MFCVSRNQPFLLLWHFSSSFFFFSIKYIHTKFIYVSIGFSPLVCSECTTYGMSHWPTGGQDRWFARYFIFRRFCCCRCCCGWKQNYISRKMVIQFGDRMFAESSLAYKTRRKCSSHEWSTKNFFFLSEEYIFISNVTKQVIIGSHKHNFPCYESPERHHAHCDSYLYLFIFSLLPSPANTKGRRKTWPARMQIEFLHQFCTVSRWIWNHIRGPTSSQIHSKYSRKTVLVTNRWESTQNKLIS